MTRWSQACCAQSAAVELVRGLRVSLCEGECNDEVCMVISLGCSGAGLFRNTLNQVLCKADPAWPPPTTLPHMVSLKPMQLIAGLMQREGLRLLCCRLCAPSNR